MRFTPSGKAVATMRLAVNHKVKKGSEIVEDVSFFDVVAFGKVAELSAEYLTKGSAVLVDGSLRERRWEMQDGQKRSKVEIIANTIRFLTPHKVEGEDAVEEIIEEVGEQES